ncbi:ABC transporter substrate-binding protein [Pseudostreptobacillus hongkongensis]|uniref:ABC transporter substrate-binding protein n=1 Tax=Pseudostreptobacillus hongkongensis TaxID=1162717 RepID=UPI0028D13CF9|nr:ABC transporter substrate-binding protein [Pseudostreptobacillus hongkongensis]
MKKLILSVLSLAFLFSCGNNAASNNKGDTTDIIKVGLPESLTGDISQYGISIKEGVELKIEEINNAGGVNGKKIELITQDTKGDLQEVVNITKKMISEDKVNAILGESISANTFAAAELAQKAKIPFITPAGTRFDITEGKDFVFRTTFTDPFQGEVLAKYIKEQGFNNVALLTNTSVDYSVGVANKFKEVAKEIGLSFTEQKYTKDDKDFKSLLTNVKNSNADVLLLPDYYNTIGLILSQAKELGLNNIQAFGSDGWDGIHKNFASVTEGAIFLTQFDLNDTTELNVKFIDAFKAKYNKDPDMFNALGYDAATLLVDALSRVDDVNNPEKIKDALKQSKIDLVTGKLEFDENRNPKKQVTFMTIKDGKLVLKDKF